MASLFFRMDIDVNYTSEGRGRSNFFRQPSESVAPATGPGFNLSRDGFAPTCFIGTLRSISVSLACVLKHVDEEP